MHENGGGWWTLRVRNIGMEEEWPGGPSSIENSSNIVTMETRMEKHTRQSLSFFSSRFARHSHPTDSSPFCPTLPPFIVARRSFFPRYDDEGCLPAPNPSRDLFHLRAISTCRRGCERGCSGSTLSTLLAGTNGRADESPIQKTFVESKKIKGDVNKFEYCFLTSPRIFKFNWKYFFKQATYLF